MDANTTRELPKIRKALERIADAVEHYADADPLTVLHQALQGEEIAADETPRHPLMPEIEPQSHFATNGHVYMYRHPDLRYHVVLRPDSVEPGGYVATIEEAG